MWFASSTPKGPYPRGSEPRSARAAQVGRRPGTGCWPRQTFLLTSPSSCPLCSFPAGLKLRWRTGWLLQPSPPKALPKLFLKEATLLGPKKRNKMTIIKVTLHTDSSPETRCSWPLTPVISGFLNRRFRPGQIARGYHFCHIGWGPLKC